MVVPTSTGCAKQSTGRIGVRTFTLGLEQSNLRIYKGRTFLLTLRVVQDLVFGSLTQELQFVFGQVKHKQSISIQGAGTSMQASELRLKT